MVGLKLFCVVYGRGSEAHVYMFRSVAFAVLTIGKSGSCTTSLALQVPT